MNISSQIDTELCQISDSVYQQIERQQQLSLDQIQMNNNEMNRQDQTNYNNAVMTRQDVLMDIVKLMPKIPYDWIIDSFHYTLLEDMVILCCTNATSRSKLLEQSSIVKTTALKSNTFWKIVRQLTGLRRTLHSIVSRYRHFWENLHPKELVKFIPYLQQKKFDYIVRMKKDIQDQMTYVQEITQSFLKSKPLQKQLEWRKLDQMKLNKIQWKTNKLQLKRGTCHKSKSDQGLNNFRIGKIQNNQTSDYDNSRKCSNKKRQVQEQNEDQLFSYGLCGSFMKQVKLEGTSIEESSQSQDQNQFKQQSDDDNMIEYPTKMIEIELNYSDDDRYDEDLDSGLYISSSFFEEKRQINEMINNNSDGRFTEQLKVWLQEKEQYLLNLSQSLGEEQMIIENELEEVEQLSKRIK